LKCPSEIAPRTATCIWRWRTKMSEPKAGRKYVVGLTEAGIKVIHLGLTRRGENDIHIGGLK